MELTIPYPLLERWAKTYSGHVLMNDGRPYPRKIAGRFQWRSRWMVCTGTMSTGRDGLLRLWAYMLGTPDEYEGPRFRAVNPTTGYRGMKVQFDGETFVMLEEYKFTPQAGTRERWEQASLL